jgi:hypothetical protein
MLLPHVPALIRERDRQIALTRTPVLRDYHRVCFERRNMRPDGKAPADLIHPAHPLMGAVLDLILEQERNRLKQGTVLLDPNDFGDTPRVLVLIDHSVREGTGATAKTISRRLQFVSIQPNGEVGFAGWAPHLDLQPLHADDLKRVEPVLGEAWLDGNVERLALTFAGSHLVPEHFTEVRDRRVRQVDKIHEAVRQRLVKEITHLNSRAIELDLEVRAGRQPRMQPDQLKRRAEELTARLQSRERELEGMRHVVSETPVVVGGAVVIPAGLIARLRGESPVWAADAAARARIERIAMEAVMKSEAARGHAAKDVSTEKCGWDITSWPPVIDGRLGDARLIEVKGRANGATTVTVTKNEILAGLNKPEQYVLAIVLVADDGASEGPFYVPRPFSQAPDWAETSRNFDLEALLARSVSLGSAS